MKTILLFDIDGTLLLTGGSGRIAFERAFHELYGIPDSWGKVHPDGKTDQMIFGEIFERHHRRAATGDEMEAIFRRYAGHFEKEIPVTPGFKIMPGFPGLLETLSERPDVLMGIATGNIREVLWFKLRHGGMHHYFRFEASATDSPARSEIIAKAIVRGRNLLEEHVPAERIFVIGDAVADIDAAKKSGVRCVSVATGSTPREELARHQPDYLFDNLGDPTPFLKAVFGV